jgi:DNA polymerase-3 subunit gamma/tau
MEKFIVSALKYRPQNFNTVIGQKHITTTLKNAIANHTLAHAFLFCGPRGVGKTTCARILAKTINCEDLQPDGEACNKCDSCNSFNDGRSLNIHELDAASNNSVDDIRDLVTQIRFAPQEGKYKIYIIDEVHMLTQQAFNAFLKTLEEPPSYAKFILATTEKHKIIPTILSRCQIFDFKRITNADTVEHLEEIAAVEKIESEKSALQLIAQKSEGCMRDALSLLDKIVSFTGGQLTYANTIEHLNLLDEDRYFQLLDALVKQDIAGALLQYDAIYSRGFEGDSVLNGFASVMRNLLVSKDARAAQLLDVLEGMQARYAEVAKGLTVSFLVTAIQVLTDAELSYRNTRNGRLHVELALIKLCYLQQVIDIAVTPEGKVTLKRRLDGPVAIREKPVAPLLLKIHAPKEGAQLKIESKELTKDTSDVPAPVKNQVNSQMPSPAQPIAQSTPMPPQEVSSIPIPKPVIPTSAPRPMAARTDLLGTLKAEKLHKSSQPGVEKQVMQPEWEQVKQIWDAYIERLKEGQRHLIITSFQIADIRIEGEAIVIKSATKINQKILEGEGSELLKQFKEHFNNPAITLSYEVNEDDEANNKEVEPRYLNSTQRFKLMAEDYPQVLALKEKLKLDLGYS